MVTDNDKFKYLEVVQDNEKWAKAKRPKNKERKTLNDAVVLHECTGQSYKKKHTSRTCLWMQQT